MMEFLAWIGAQPSLRTDPWLVLGKGPTFRLRDRYDLREFRTLSLNHAVREQPVLLAHMIDLEVAEDCADAILENARFLVLPWIPHVRHRPRKHTLERLTTELPLLRQMEREQRLLWYNLGSKRLRERLGWPSRHREGSPIVNAKHFSVEAVLNLLGAAGVRTVRSLGIDGGAAYSHEFADLTGTTLLSNGQKSFDRQFREIARIIMKTGMDYAPLNVPSPIRVYVGSMEEQMLPVKVLEYSIKKHTSMSVEVFPLHHAGIEVPMPRDRSNRPRTPFSFQRFMIPQLAGYQGRALYLDSDMQVFRDIRELWSIPFAGADLLAVGDPGSANRKPQFSVMLLDCEALAWKLPEIVDALDRGDYDYQGLMYEMRVATQIRANIPPIWNSLEHYQENKTGLLHYTDMHRQPWVATDNPLGYLWVRDLIDAVDNGFLSMDFVREHVDQGHVRPSLVYQIENRLEDPLLLPKEAHALDAGFVAPFRKMQGAGGPVWVRAANVLRAMARSAVDKNPLTRAARGVRARLSD